MTHCAVNAVPLQRCLTHPLTPLSLKHAVASLLHLQTCTYIFCSWVSRALLLYKKYYRKLFLTTAGWHLHLEACETKRAVAVIRDPGSCWLQGIQTHLIWSSTMGPRFHLCTGLWPSVPGTSRLRFPDPWVPVEGGSPCVP